jgi:putative membrane protein
MEDRTIHPSMKTVWLAYVVVFIVIGAGIGLYYTFGQDRPAWLMAIPLVLLVIPLRMHFTRRLITLRLQDHHLTLETGLFSRTRRTVDMAKIQDVTVNQTLGQRMLGVGDLVLEDSGQRGGMAIRNVDSPREIADAIIASSKRSPIAVTPTEPTGRN